MLNILYTCREWITLIKQCVNKVSSTWHKINITDTRKIIIYIRVDMHVYVYRLATQMKTMKTTQRGSLRVLSPN